jgi:Tfp pilus assembly protein PilF
MFHGRNFVQMLVVDGGACCSFRASCCVENSVFITPKNGSTPVVTNPSRFQTPFRREILVPVACLVAAALAAYHNSFGGPFVFDDGPSIINNPGLRPPWSLRELLWPSVQGGATVSGRPVVNLTFALNMAFGGQAVRGYHVVNLLIHVLAGLLLFGLIRRTLTQPVLAGRLGAIATSLALAVALLWTVHPLQTESVTYIVQRTESLVGLWYLLTLYALVRGATGGGRRWLAVSVAACWLGMATKEVMATAPLVVLLHDRTFVAGSFVEAWRRRRGYYLSLAASWLLLGLLVAAAAGRGGTAGWGTEVSPWTYALTQCEAMVRYLGLVFWPRTQVFDYGTHVVGGLGEVWPQAVVVLALVAGTIWALWRRPVWGFLGAWFLVILAPSSSVVPVASQTMAEHRMYLPLAAPMALLAGFLFLRLGRLAWVVCGLLVLTAGALTVARNTDYATDHALWADTVAKRPANARAHLNLGLAELAQGDLAGAHRLVSRAIQLAPESAEPHYNLGLILTRQGRLPEAMASYERAIAQAPEHSAAHNNLGNVLFTTGRIEEAGRHYAEAVRLDPAFAGARNSYGHWLLETGRPASSIRPVVKRTLPRLLCAAARSGWWRKAAS